jgi:hypothetical protein
MRLLYDNIVDGLSAASVVASSSDASFPATNVQDERLAKRWMSDTGATAQTVTFTLPTFPLYPDSATGTTYIQDAWATNDGWVAGGSATISVASAPGCIRAIWASATTFGIYRTISGVSAKTGIVRIRGSSAMTIVASTLAGTAYSSFSIATSWSNISFDFPSVSSNLYLSNDAGTSGRYFDADFIYVGDGTYTTTLPDLSGNGNVGTVSGAISVSATSGTILQFDGVNDRIAYSPTLGIVSDFSVGIWASESSTTGTRILFRLGAGFNTNGVYAQAGGASSNYSFQWGRAGASESGGFFALTSALDYHVLTYTAATKTWTTYKNGVLVSSGTLTNTPVAPTSALEIGAYASNNYFAGSIGEAHIYGRVLSLAEIGKLYAGTRWLGENSSLVGKWEPNCGYGINTTAILGHNILHGTIAKIQATNNSLDWTTPELNTTLTVNDGAILNFATTASVYKYWRFYFYGQGSIEVGRMWLGKYLTIDPSALEGFKVTMKNSDVVAHGKDRQKYATPGYSWRVFDLSFPATREDMIYPLTVMREAVGNHSSMIFCNFDTIRDYTLVEPCYVSINGDLSFTQKDRDGFTWSIVLEEEL